MEKELLNSGKELLLKDLCGRIPYKVRMFEIEPVNNIQSNLTLLSVTNKESVICITPSGGVIASSIDAFKPYLFPLSSMTEEQLNDFYATIRPVIEEALDAWKIDKTEYEGERPITLKDIKADIVAVNWMLKNHFDMNGLIPKGLAIDATGLNIY